MRFLRYLVLVCIAVIAGTVSAQSQRELGQLMRERGEYYFTLTVDNPKEIQAISEICSVDGTDGRRVVAYANQNEYDRLLQAGFQPELQTPPSLRANVTMWNGQGTYNWDSYLTYDQYVSMMNGFPSMAISGRNCSLFSLGTLSTSNHRQLLGVRINNGSPEGKPKFLYTSTMHGDEITGMIIMLRLINELCTSTDSQIVDLVNNLDIYIMPLTNPDGTYKGGNNTVNSAQRYNGNNIDLNRNYKDYYKGAHPDGNSYEDETVWTMAMGDENLFTMSANYHGGAEVMNYPWDAVYDDHADMNWYEYVCSQYVQIARQTYSSYMSDTYSDGVTNGADWYVITGSRQDYMNAYAQCREVTVECSTTKTPSASALPSFWNYNRNSMLAFMEQCLKGVHGFVYDANTNQPIEGVKVTVMDHDSETSFVTTHVVGDFHRPIKGGSYTFEFTKDGYCPYYVDVTVADGQRVELNNIQLTPGNCMVPSFTASTTEVSLGQSISFTDNSFGTIASWSWTFEGATPSTSTAQNPTNITYSTAGDYDVTLIITDADGNSQTLTKENYIHVAESITMQNGSVTTCSGIFYDSGGPNSNYGNNLTYTMTFYPGTEGAMVSVNFTQFNTESGYDYLYIYDGTSTSATLIGRYDGTTSPGTVMATNSAGALTFRFTSDSGVNAAGWVAAVSCISTDPVDINVSANPARAGSVSGGGEYAFGTTCTVTATPNEGYIFMNWTENGTIVSEDMEYSFNALNDRDLVAHFSFSTAVSGICYHTVNNISAGSYVMGSLNGTTLSMPTHNNTSTMVSTTATAVSTDYGFSLDEGTNLPKVTLTAYGNSQFYIVYNNRYLSTSSSGSTRNPIWSSSNTNTSTRWYINTNGIYVAISSGSWSGSTTNYYLYYDTNSSSFKLSTSNQNNNIAFYTEGDCPASEFTITATAEPSEGGTIEGADVYFQGEMCTLTATANEGYVFVNWTENGVEASTEANYSFEVTADRNLVANFEEEVAVVNQVVTLPQGTSWWSTYLDITIDDLKAAIAGALGTTGTATIKSQSGYITYSNGQWRPSSGMTLDIRQMYMIQVSTACTFTLTGVPVDPTEHVITLHNGSNWIGFLSGESLPIATALSNLTPENGDVIKGKQGYATYNGTGWRGTMTTLEPGQGYIYQSKATDDKTFTYGTNSSKK